MFTCPVVNGLITNRAKVYQPGWNEIEAGQIPAVILVRDGAALPHIALAQSTDKMDWSNIELRLLLPIVLLLRKCLSPIG